MAVFDVVVNNADRKGGHVLAMPDGHRYGVDHGVCFHVDDKLRTVLWGWAGEPLRRRGRRRRDRRCATSSAARRASCARPLAELLAADEVAALRRRCERLLRRGGCRVPSGRWPAIPWPAF